MSKQAQKKSALEEIQALEKKIELREGLPHLYGLKLYKWAREFIECTEKEQFLVSGNQLSKSSTQIRKTIEWAGNPSLWPKLWPGKKPNQFWYLYPSRDMADQEFNTKWMQFLPAGKYKDHPTYGWKAFKERNMIKYLKFNSGVVVYFKTYNQDPADLQGGSCYSIFCDEELDVNLLPELQLRLAATDGYFHMVFTATLGQEHWRCCMEEIGTDLETHPTARKWHVTAYDCLTYEDGTPSPWTIEKIKKVEARCGSKAEIDKRVLGRFIVSGGLMFESFDRDLNTCEPFPIPPTWFIYTGVDIGSGGEKGHPSAITFVAVAPDYKRAVVFKGWRGDGIQTTASDVLMKYIELRGGLKPVLQSYDWENRDFFTIASRIGESFTPAEKGRDSGRQLLNVLLKNRMLKIFRGDPQLDKLIAEFVSLLEVTAKSKAIDDFCFVSGTKIKTPSGDKNIEDLVYDDLVLTREGPRRIYGLLRRNEITLDLRFSDGVSLRCTEDHPFFTQNKGWVKASELTPLDTLYTYSEWQNQKRLPSRELSLEDTQTQDKLHIEDTTNQVGHTFLEGSKHFIKKFGKMLTEKFRKATTSTTKMVIIRITIFQILNVLKALNTLVSTCLKELKRIKSGSQIILIKRESKLANGINQKKQNHFINGLVRCHGKHENLFLRFVLSVVLNLKQKILGILRILFAPINVSQHTVGNLGLMIFREDVLFAQTNLKLTGTTQQSIAPENAPLRLEQKKLVGVAEVFNISVRGTPEYFANGILVSNCDATRYSLGRIPFDWTAVESEADSSIPTIVKEKKQELSQRELSRLALQGKQVVDHLDDEMEFWNGLME